VLNDDEVVSALLQALPSLQNSWEPSDSGPVVDAGQVARHLVLLIDTGGHEAEIDSFFRVVEDLFIQLPLGTSSAALDTGLIEGIQNISMGKDSPMGSSRFLSYLGPRTLEVWRKLHEFWDTVDT
jgi:hypothetical protein